VFSVHVMENLKVHLKTHTKKMSDILRELVSSHAMKDVPMQVLVFVFVNQRVKRDRLWLPTYIAVYNFLHLQYYLSFYLTNTTWIFLILDRITIWIC
jgi:hypothetical protein